MTLLRWQCNRCGHEWVPRTEGVPARCPKCKTPYWNKARVRHGRSGREPVLIPNKSFTIFLDLSKVIVP